MGALPDRSPHAVLSGGSGNDRLHGSAGADQLFGDPGEDEFDGGSGTDKANRDTVDLLSSIEAKF